MPPIDLANALSLNEGPSAPIISSAPPPTRSSPSTRRPPMSVLIIASTGMVVPVFERPRPWPAFHPIFSSKANPRPESTGRNLSLDRQSFVALGTSAPDARMPSEPMIVRFLTTVASGSYATSAPPPAAPPAGTIALAEPSAPGSGGLKVSWSVSEAVLVRASGAASSSSSSKSASLSPAPQCHCVFAFMMATSTSFSYFLASEEPASALSMRKPAMRRLWNCSAFSPGRRFSMPVTARWA
mmetsp:Transcript_50999/g.101434  ORF Transcript_50999/g.101434 Transcript_50999/m.101434 type:complete len:241 (+) Transcript_50999:163-885(+)